MKFLVSLICLISSLQLLASEKNVYDFSWLDQDKEVYVLQNRKFRKKNKLYIGAMGGAQINGAFIDSNEFSFHGGYFFKEDWGLEFSYSKSSGTVNKTEQGVRDQGAKPFYRKVDTLTSAMVVWAPFYAKINTFNKIFYYDWMFGVGMANVTTKDNRLEFGSNGEEPLTEETNTAPTWMTNFRFYITQDWSAEIRFEGLHINADVAKTNEANSVNETEKRWSHYYDIKLGLNYTF